MSISSKSNNSFEITSTKIDVICFKIHNLDCEKIILELNKYFTKFKDIKLMPFVIDLQNLTDAWQFKIEKFINFCKKNDLNLIGIKHNDPVFKALASKHNLFFSLDKKDTTTNKQNNYSNPLIIDIPIRSGQQVYAKNCDLILLNKVNEGAEVISDGNIHIYSIMKGRAIAGANNNKNARIFINNMQAQLVSISGVYRTFDRVLPPSLNKKQVIISLQNDKLMITAL